MSETQFRWYMQRMTPNMIKCLLAIKKSRSKNGYSRKMMADRTFSKLFGLGLIMFLGHSGLMLTYPGECLIEHYKKEKRSEKCPKQSSPNARESSRRKSSKVNPSKSSRNTGLRPIQR